MQIPFHVFVLGALLLVVGVIAIVLAVLLLAAHAELKNAEDAKRRAQRGPVNLRDLEPGEYKLIALLYYAKLAFGTGEIENKRRGLMQVQQDEAVYLVHFKLDQYDDTMPLASGIRIEVTTTDGVTLFRCVN